MIQAIPKQLTFDEFIAWYPENSEHRYELHDGVIIAVKTGWAVETAATQTKPACAGFQILNLLLVLLHRKF
jgi:Uma2 family endonuclease